VPCLIISEQRGNTDYRPIHRKRASFGKDSELTLIELQLRLLVVQGCQFYRGAKEGEKIPGFDHPAWASTHLAISNSAWRSTIDRNKVGRI